MSVLTFQSEEFDTFPSILKEYASYMAAIRGNSEKTVCEYLLDLRTFFRFYLLRRRRIAPTEEEMAKTEISDLTTEEVISVTEGDIVDFLMYTVSSRKNESNTRLRKISALRSFYRYLHAKRHLTEKDPTADIEGPKTKKALPKYLTYEESVTLLDTVRSDNVSKTVVRDYAMIALFLNTGMRLSELVGLNIRSFDRDMTYVKVLGKGNKERIIYLNDAAKDAVRSYLELRLDPSYVVTDDPALFLSERAQRISAKTVQFVVYKYLDMSGLGNRGLSVHKLRHTAATLMYQSGAVDVRVLKEVLGHEQLNTTQIYTHVVSRNMEDAVAHNPLADIKMKKGGKTDDNR